MSCSSTLYSPPTTVPAADPLDLGFLGDIVAGAVRLTPAQGLALYQRAPLHLLGRYADARCRAIHGESIRTYVIDRNINYTNVCTARCTFCAFRRDLGDADAYTLEPGAIHEKIAELTEIGGTQILMQGGMNPELPLDWYLDLLRGIKERFAHVHIHAFSPPELIEFVEFFQPAGATLEEKLRWVMVRLREAGLDSIPGGGGEIFADPVRRKIGLGKCDAQAWLTCMNVAHSLGMFTSATMMFGHIEGLADRIHHMALVREWQDRALSGGSTALRAVSGNGGSTALRAVSGNGGSTALRAVGMNEHRSETCATTENCAATETCATGRGHYTAFISWPFQKENTPLGNVPDWGERAGELESMPEFPGDVVATLAGDGDAKAHRDFGRRVRRAGATDYLRTQAISRLMLDNIYSIGASWVTMGPHIGQVALQFGANDMGSVMMEENVVSAAGTTYCLNEPVLCRLIREAGFVPAQRDNVYDLLKVHDGAESPDLVVSDWSEHRVQKLHVEGGKVESEVVAVGVSVGE